MCQSNDVLQIHKSKLACRAKKKMKREDTKEKATAGRERGRKGRRRVEAERK